MFLTCMRALPFSKKYAVVSPVLGTRGKGSKPGRGGFGPVVELCGGDWSDNSDS